MGLTIFMGFLVIVMSLVSDLVAAMVDPELNWISERVKEDECKHKNSAAAGRV